MSRLVIFIVSCVVCLSSCGAQRRLVSQDLQTDIESSYRDTVNLKKQIDQLVKMNIEEIINREVEQNIEITRMLFSEPDSTGKQYIKEQFVIVADIISKESKERETNKQESITRISDSSVVSDNSMNLISESIVEQTEKPPWYHDLSKDLALIGVVVLILLLAIKQIFK